jgi:hypothetical protein
LKLITLAEYLLDAGAIVKYRDKNGMTPLNYAKIPTCILQYVLQGADDSNGCEDYIDGAFGDICDDGKE